MATYSLRCLATEARLNDNYTNRYHQRGLLRAEYQAEHPRTAVETGVWKWGGWLQGAGADTVFGITQPTADSTVRSTWLSQQAEA
jgi:hypothetical protein|tara:strand:+ start:53 stop:307 length:255 start_codon:yes stop_codon:yes gene_type:complete